MRISRIVPLALIIAGAALLTAGPGIHLAAQEVLADYAGTWVDNENADNRMLISEDEGLLRVAGGDENFGYSASCLVNSGKAACMGSGGKLEGENFLYESLIQFAEDGTAIESWKAFNNQSSTQGATNWRRE